MVRVMGRGSWNISATDCDGSGGARNLEHASDFSSNFWVERQESPNDVYFFG